jgi:hypothetical protein
LERSATSLLIHPADLLYPKDLCYLLLQTASQRTAEVKGSVEVLGLRGGDVVLGEWIMEHGKALE